MHGKKLCSWLMALVCGCLAMPLLAAERPRSLYDGASVEFARAWIVKPRDNPKLALAVTLAPLILQEASGKQKPELPTKVFFKPGTVRLNGPEHAQMTYWWFYVAPPKPAEHRPPARRGPEVRPLKSAGSETGAPGATLRFQGVRLTLSTNGTPMIYEVLGHGGRIEQIYVTQSVETAAHIRHGLALPGRRSSAEPRLDDAPHVVVPRVLDDPPAVMGPILYLRADTHEVATLICRCMPAQAKALAGQGLYKLVAGGFPRNTSSATRPEAAFPRWLREDFSNQTNRLSRSLRLPADF
jgi:hypothetical protein